MFKQIERKTIYQSEWVNVLVDKVEMPTGQIIEKQHILDIRNSVVGVVLNPSNEILLVQVYRYITGALEWELPAGFIDDNELPQNALIREISEETGCEIKNIKQLTNFYSSNGLSNQQIFAFSAYCDTKPRATYDKNEIKTYQWVAISTIKQMLMEDEFTCGITTNVLLNYLFRLK